MASLGSNRCDRSRATVTEAIVSGENHAAVRAAASGTVGQASAFGMRTM